MRPLDPKDLKDAWQDDQAGKVWDELAWADLAKARADLAKILKQDTCAKHFK